MEHSFELGSLMTRQSASNNDSDSNSRLFSNILTSIQGNNYLEGNVIRSLGGLTTFKSGSTLIETLGNFNIGSKVGILIRSEDIILSKEMVKTSARNVVKSKVVKITKYDAAIVDVFMVADTFHLRSRITEEARADLQICQGDDVFAIFKASSPQVVREEEKEEE